MKTKILILAAAALLMLVFLATLAPVFLGSSQFLFRESSLTIIYAVLALCIAMITFGVLNDSSALVNISKEKRLAVSISGSAAGFAIFYYLFSSGINPFGYTDFIFIDESGSVMTEIDEGLEFGVLGRISQFSSPQRGRLLLPLPRSADTYRVSVKGRDGRAWSISSVKPDECAIESNRIRSSCPEIEIHLVENELCLSDLLVVSYESEQVSTKLETIFDSLTENIQNFPGSPSVVTQYSDALVSSQLLTEEFTLERKAKEARPVCEHLAAIENRFNVLKGQRLIRTYITCDNIGIQLSTENEIEESRTCLP